MKTSHFSFLLPQPKVSFRSNFDSTQITSHKYEKTTKNIHKETFFLSLLPIHKHKHTWKCLPFCFMVSVLLRWSSRREWGEGLTGLLVQEKGVVPQHRGQGCVFVCVWCVSMTEDSRTAIKFSCASDLWHHPYRGGEYVNVSSLQWCNCFSEI